MWQFAKKFAKKATSGWEIFLLNVSEWPQKEAEDIFKDLL